MPYRVGLRKDVARDATEFFTYCLYAVQAVTMRQPPGEL